MKKCKYAALIAIAIYGQHSIAEVDELTIMQHTNQAAKKTTIGAQADTHLKLSKQFVNIQSQVISHTISHPGADYIKVHFSRVQLSGNAKLVVRNQDNTERYEYSSDNMNAATIDDVKGDDGVHSFSAMSVSNDSVIIEYYPDPTLSKQQTQFGIIDSYFYGTESDINTNTELNNGNEPALLSTCGVNERKDVQCWADSHPIEFDRSRPIARLVIGGRSLCTGWRVGSDNKLFTNNHCIETASELASTEVWFNYQNKSCNGSTKETVVKVTGNEFFKTDYTLDYTLFSVNDFSTIEQFGYLGLDVRNAQQSERIYIPQHGSGNPKELAIESDQDNDGLCQVNAPSTNGRGNNTDIGYYCDTIGGSSGSPVVAASSNRVIALHHLGGCYNKGAKISKIWPQVASYFNGTVPIGDNDGNTPPAPTARFEYNCDQLQCNFDATGSSSSGTITNYSWDFGDNQIDSGATVQHTFTSTGNYNVSVTVQDSNNNTNTLAQLVSVSDGTSSDIELNKGQALPGLNATRNQESIYFIDVPADANNIMMSISGGNGDADLYVKKGAKPTTSDYDCRPFKNGNEEICTVNLGEGRYYIMLKAYSSYNNVTIMADYKNSTPPTGDSTIITSRAYGFPGFWQRYSYLVPTGKTSVTISTAGSQGDISLYVNADGAVTQTKYDCQSKNPGSNESCTLAVNAGQSLQIGLLGIVSYDWVKLVATAQ
ncbi:MULTISPECIES: pre-peptidase C-terminal domain-containing protein [unclassified Pseudoalteromonas]|uniref:pre-peptidase C-terminal domain-containing protein n=1 Tax=unclassified Pseudoalteromonas TaxID=194690 RepID=UPI0015FFBAB2|nr:MULTISPECIES: pre-peptidase C-terminal domain-containing protein [unclassified Pseudoalteromonas]MBB1301010.1 PKD domain-containing protein [Pseudoalteromonas sp. SR44-8]MBB1411402.1 PKD domain-containing protein [Pseudoalteromonas sp. SG44-17]